MLAISDIGKARTFLKNKNIFLYIYYLSIVAIIVGFLYSRALLSIGQISLVIIWAIEGDLRAKVDRFLKNRTAILLSGLYLMHVIYLLNTSDFVYAAEDLRIKLPLLLFPIVLSSTEIISVKTFRYTLLFFVAIIFSSTVVISINYLLNGQQMEDIREASFLISHIRLALMICLSIAISIYYASKLGGLGSLGLMALSIWFTGYMIYFAYLTGIAILVMLLLFFFIWYLKKSTMKKGIKQGILFGLLVIFSSVSIYVINAATEYYSSSSVKQIEDLKLTAGNRHYTQWYKPNEYSIRENGYLVFQNISFEEVENEWNRRSDLKVSFLDDDHTGLEDILLRFLASKGLPKDSVSVVSLSPEEISSIEEGITNVNYIGKSRLHNRLYNMFWQYDIYITGGNFNGHSLGIRMEFWKTGYHVFKRNFWFGTGTGDIEQAFQEQYQIDNSSLSQEWRFRSHNQIISMAATFGIFGLLYFLVVLIVPILEMKNKFLYMSFAIIFVLSILTEDTLETQIGVTFYAFFNSLLFFQNQPSKE